MTKGHECTNIRYEEEEQDRQSLAKMGILANISESELTKIRYFIH